MKIKIIKKIKYKNNCYLITAKIKINMKDIKKYEIKKIENFKYYYEEVKIKYK
jgi:hypothetical protein